MSKSINLTAVDLFAGAGGTAVGFKRAGFRILAAVENEPNAALTYSRNIGIEVTPSDIRSIDPAAFRASLGLASGQLDVLIGCPPCQGFSRMRNGHGKHDARNDLVLVYKEFVEELHPRFAVFENVPGLVNGSTGKSYYRKLKQGLRGIGYALLERTLDAANYGVAQRRKRIIVIAGRDGEMPPLPQPTHAGPKSSEVKAGVCLPWLTVRDAIGQFPRVKAGEDGSLDGQFPNHKAPRITKQVLEFIRHVPRNGGSRTDVARELWLLCHLKHSGHADVYGRLSWDRTANTITAGCTNLSKGRFVHPEQNRALTAREAAALQGFPNDFVFYGHQVAAQIGNAVPPPLAEVIAVALRKRLESSGAYALETARNYGEQVPARAYTDQRLPLTY